MGLTSGSDVGLMDPTSSLDVGPLDGTNQRNVPSMGRTPWPSIQIYFLQKKLTAKTPPIIPPPFALLPPYPLLPLHLLADKASISLKIAFSVIGRRTSFFCGLGFPSDGMPDIFLGLDGGGGSYE